MTSASCQECSFWLHSLFFIVLQLFMIVFQELKDFTSSSLVLHSFIIVFHELSRILKFCFSSSIVHDCVSWNFQGFCKFFIGSSIVHDCVPEPSKDIANSSLVHELVMNVFQELLIFKRSWTWLQNLWSIVHELYLKGLKRSWFHEKFTISWTILRWR